MADITVTKIDNVWMKVLCKETYMELDIGDRFKFPIKNRKHHPKVKAGVWDGYKKLYNRKTKRMYVGLLLQLLEFCDKNDYSVYVDPDLIPNEEDSIEQEDLEHLVEFINPHADPETPLEPYDDQYEAVSYMLNMNRSVCLSATSSGKSMIIYLAARIYQLMDEMQGKHIFISVPSVDLVEQLYGDFKEYSTFQGSNWNVAKHVQKISGDYCKDVSGSIVITTWHSFATLPRYVYDNIGAVIVDECHSASADVLTNILENLPNTDIRHGLTGTLDKTECNESVIQGLLGPAKKIVNAKELIEKGRATPVKVYMTILNHSEQAKKSLENDKSKIKAKGAGRYNLEIEYLNQSRERREFIKNMIASIPGNSVIIFDHVDSYGKELYEEFKAEYDFPTYLNIGEIKKEDRSQIREMMKGHTDAKLFASSGTMKQGISIKNLHNMFIISSSKSFIKLVQSIGRMMRLHDSKDVSRVIDIVDNLTIDKSNYAMNHAHERVQIYSEEGHHISFDEYDLPSPKNEAGGLFD